MKIKYFRTLLCVQGIHSGQPAVSQPRDPYCRDIRRTFFRSPTAEVLVQVESRLAVPEFYIGQPLGDDVQNSGIESNLNAYPSRHTLVSE